MSIIYSKCVSYNPTLFTIISSSKQFWYIYYLNLRNGSNAYHENLREENIINTTVLLDSRLINMVYC